MNLVNKLIRLLFYFLLVTEVFPQGQFYISTNGNINNSFLTRSIYNISTFTPLKKNSSAAVLDSLIYISTYVDRKRIAYNYNDDLSLDYFTFADWYNDEWINSEKHTNIYNSEGKLISVLWELFNSTTKEWYQTEKDSFNYDPLKNRIFGLHQFFNGQEFVNDFKYEDCYDAANNFVSSVNQHWIDGIWVNSSKSIYTYTPEKVKDTTLMQDWKNDQWVNYQLNIYEYDEKLDIISNLAKRWQENNWLNFGKGSFEYDVNNNCVLENWEIASNNSWENWFRILYEYDDNNNLIHQYGEEWENDTWIPENELLKVTNPDGILYGYLAKEIFLFYRNPTSIRNEKNIPDGFNLLQNYPNPFNPTTIINYSVPKTSFVTIKLYDVLGKVIKTLVNEEKPVGNYNFELNAYTLTSGIYFYRMQAGNFVETKKLILLK